MIDKSVQMMPGGQSASVKSVYAVAVPLQKT